MHKVSMRARLAGLAGIALIAAALIPLAAPVVAATATVKPITGGQNIPSNTARIGGSGRFTTLTGPTITEGSPGLWSVGSKFTLTLPENFEWNRTRTTAPGVAHCALVSSPISYSGAAATITMKKRSGASQLGSCTINFNTLLQVRPVSSSVAAGTGGVVGLTFVDSELPMPQVFPNGAGRVTMAVTVVIPTPTPTPITPSGPPTVIPATGGTGIQSNTALTGGSGAWTTLSGPTITEGSLGAWPIGTRIALTLPANFQWNQARTSVSVTGCDRNATSIVYSGNDSASVTLAQRQGASQMALCTISFGSQLQVRPLNSASSAGTGGTIGLAFSIPTPPSQSVFPGGAGQVSMVTSEPPVGPMTLTATAPTMNNNAILWGEAVTLTTAGSPGTVFQMQVTVDDPATVTNPRWETLTDGSRTPPVPWSFTIPSSGQFAWDYRPIRNYWYRAVAGTTTSNTPRVTVRQTIAIRPQNSSTQTIGRGRQITFTATVRPARPELVPAIVAFQLFRRGGSGWVLDQTINRTIDANGIATWTWTASSSGSFYVRAQAQPTPVNANSFWTPNQFYNVQ